LRKLKPWSIPTFACSPDRLRLLLATLAELDGEIWSWRAQREFQIRLVQKLAFIHLLSPEDMFIVATQADFPYERAEKIYDTQKYTDVARRANEIIKPLRHFGFVIVRNSKLTVTESGQAFLAEKRDYCDVFLRFLLKWQLPNPLSRNYPSEHGYEIKPFVSVLRLIAAINGLSKENSEREVGISFSEFAIFAITLINWKNIDTTAAEIMDFRRDMQSVPSAKRSACFSEAYRKFRPNFNVNRCREYAQTAVQYFRITKYVTLNSMDNSHYISLERSRQVEIQSLFNRDSGRAIPFAN